MEINNVFNDVIRSHEVKNTAKADLYDLDVEINEISTQPGALQHQAITSKSLCTPGCGNTGTGNSFCC